MLGTHVRFAAQLMTLREGNYYPVSITLDAPDQETALDTVAAFIGEYEPDALFALLVRIDGQHHRVLVDHRENPIKLDRENACFISRRDVDVACRRPVELLHILDALGITH